MHWADGGGGLQWPRIKQVSVFCHSLFSRPWVPHRVDRLDRQRTGGGHCRATRGSSDCWIPTAFRSAYIEGVLVRNTNVQGAGLTPGWRRTSSHRGFRSWTDSCFSDPPSSTLRRTSDPLTMRQFLEHDRLLLNSSSEPSSSEPGTSSGTGGVAAPPQPEDPHTLPALPAAWTSCSGALCWSPHVLEHVSEVVRAPLPLGAVLGLVELVP